MTTTMVKFPQGKNSYNMLTLKADKRIKFDAIRVLRTLKPNIGTIYADSRRKGVRYKIAFSGMTAQQRQEFVELLNSIYELNNISAKAYLKDAHAAWSECKICVFVKDWQ